MEAGTEGTSIAQPPHAKSWRGAVILAIIPAAVGVVMFFPQEAFRSWIAGNTREQEIAKTADVENARLADATADEIQTAVGPLLTELRGISSLTTVAIPLAPDRPVVSPDDTSGIPFKAASDDRIAEASARARAEIIQFDKTWSEWRGALDKRRRHVRQYFGVEAGNRFNDTASQNYKLDSCSIVITRDDPADGQDCSGRRLNESESLNRAVDVENRTDDGLSFRDSAETTGLHIPPDLHTNISIARQALANSITCLETIARDGASIAFRNRCRTVRGMAVQRVNLAGSVNNEFARALEEAVSKRTLVKSGSNY